MRSEAALALLVVGAAQALYRGKDLGALSELHHGVRGRVFAVDSRTLYLQDFTYDGEGPAAYFYVGNSKTPSATGATRVRDERGNDQPLRRYRGESITVSLPEGKTLKDVTWFAVWCDEYSISFGSVSIPKTLEPPRPARVAALRGAHGVSSEPLVVVDAQTLLVPNFSYDGEAPDAKFWVGRGKSPSPEGIRIPDENGKEAPLRRYTNKTIVLTLPGELTVFDIGHFGVWCEAFTVDFGHVVLPPAALSNVPPSLKMLGVSPQSKLNCEVLYDELAFEVRWAIAGDSVVLQLVAKLEDGEYMSFGISGDPDHSRMIGGDVAVAWVDKNTLKGVAEDSYMEGKSQCAGGRGACPDDRIKANTGSIRLLNAALVNGYSIVTYQRSLKAADELDLPVYTNTSQPIIWAIGPLNSEKQVSYHQYFTKSDKFIEFGRPPLWNCPMPEGEEIMNHPAEDTYEPTEEEHKAVIRPNPVPTPRPTSKVEPWDIPGIQCYEPPDGVFYAQMGPTGGKQGYSAITGHVGWGISWYINGLLIPEITVVRGKTYTFVVEGGTDPEVPAKYHPFYITNDPIGGYYHKTAEEKQGIQIYAGVKRARNGELVPIGTGRICNWTPDNNGPEADEYPSFGAYQRSLTLVCDEGKPGVVTWIPDEKTPDTVYYQCYTHRYLGWKINVVDYCDETLAAESRVVESVVMPDLMGVESIQVQSRVKPDKNFLNQRTKIEKIINMKNNYNDFSSDKGESGLSGELYPEPNRHLLHPSGHEYELPISTGQIKEVIEAVESLEDQMKDEMKRNATYPQKLQQYQVHEDVKEFFVPEQPIRDGDEYVVEMGKLPEIFMLPPNQKPQTLHNVLRPNAPSKHIGNMRPPFRRPVPPEIKLRRPYPTYQKGNNQYPLQMPNPHGMSKKPSKYPINRPPPPHMHHRPSPSNIPPMKAMPPLHSRKPEFNQPPPKYAQKTPNIPKQTIAISKPGNNIGQPQSQTLSLGHTDIIANQVVKSQITLPGSNDALAQHSIPQTFYNKPGQIILGKPMDHPQPLDLSQTKPEMVQPIRLISTQLMPQIPEIFLQSTTVRSKVNENTRSQVKNEIKSSDFIGQSADISTVVPAVNTGFKPDSIVIESGFKPIIREPLMAGEDKIAEFDGASANRREDTDIEEEYQESPQYINTNYAYSSDKLTETFEPMFIPSPPDHFLANNDRTKEVFPSNHAKEDRPHPVYVKTESELNALFGKKNMEKDVPSDMVMESDKVSPQYLPPDPKLPKEHYQKIRSEQTFTTYDGKTVSADTLTSVPEESKSNLKIFSSKLPANSELLLRTPQFGPFKGKIPPMIAEHINKDSVHEDDSNLKDMRTTKLKLVNAFHKANSPDLQADGSETHDKKVKDTDEYEEYEEGEIEEDESRRRKRDTKTAQFERGNVEEAAVLNSEDDMNINNMDFEFVSPLTHASSSKINLLPPFLIIPLLLKLF